MKKFLDFMDDNRALKRMDVGTGEVVDVPVDSEAGVFVRHPHHRLRVQTFIKGESMTQQSHQDLVDVNNIVKRYAETGILPKGSLRQGQFADVTGLQGDPTELILKSRDTLSRAEQGAKTAAAKRAAAKPDDQQAPAVSAPPAGGQPASDTPA